MTCKAVNTKISEYLDGELSGLDMLAIRHHLHSCKFCEKEFEQTRGLKWLLGNLSETEPGEEFADQLKRRVFSSTIPGRKSILPIALLSSFAFTAAVVITFTALRAATPPAPKIPLVSLTPSNTNYDLARDQAYQTAGDPFSDGSLVLTVSNAAH